MEAEELFELSLEECLPPTDTAGPSGDIDGLASLHLSYLLRPSSHYQAQVLRDAQAVLAAAPAEQAAADPAALAGELAVRGHLVALRQVQGGGAGGRAFRTLPNLFVVVSNPAAVAAQAGAQAGEPLLDCDLCRGGCCGAELILDANFKGHFYVPRCTPRYASIVALLPTLFVGPACQLEHLVDWLSREMFFSFKQQGDSLPPWRRKESLMSRWLPQPGAAQDTPVRPPGLPASPTTPTALHPAPAQQTPPAGPSALAAPPAPVSVVPRTSYTTAPTPAPTCLAGGAGWPTVSTPAELFAAAPAAGHRRVVVVQPLCSLTVGGALAEDAGAACGSPLSPTLSCGSSGGSSPVSTLPTRALPPFGLCGCQPVTAADMCCGNGAERRAEAAAVSLLTLQLARVERRLLVAV